MSTLDYFDQTTLAILHGQGCQPEAALRLARDLVERRVKFVEEMGLVPAIIPEEVRWLYAGRPTPGTAVEVGK